MSLFEVSKHIIRVIFYDHVLHIHIIIDRQFGHFAVRMYCSQSCSLFSYIIEVSFIQSFIIVGLLYRSLVQFNKVFRSSTFPSKVVWTTTSMACKYLAFAFSLTFAFVLHVFVVAFAFLEFTKFLVMIIRSIISFITLHIMVNLW
jgi:hypothetical protein